LIGIGFAIAGLPSPVVFGVLAALLSMLPVGGAAFVWGRPRSGCSRRPLGLRHLHAGLGICCWAGLDNVLRPCSFPGAREYPPWRCSSACSAGFRPSAPSASSPGPVVLSLALGFDRVRRGRPPAKSFKRRNGAAYALAGPCRGCSTIRALMDVSHLLDGLNDASARRWPRRWARRWCWPAPAAARPACWCTGSPG
jgi:hypothetical protein